MWRTHSCAMPLSFVRSAHNQNIAFGLCLKHGLPCDVWFIHAVGASRVVSLAAAADGYEGAQRNLFGALGDVDDDEPAAANPRDAGEQRGTTGAGPVRSVAEPVQASTGKEDRPVHGWLLPGAPKAVQTIGEPQCGGINRTSPQPPVGIRISTRPS